MRRVSPTSDVVHSFREDGSLAFILLPEVVAFFLLTSFLFEILWRLNRERKFNFGLSSILILTFILEFKQVE